MSAAPKCTLCGSPDTAIRYPSTLGTGQGWSPGFDPYSGHYQINHCAACGVVYSAPIFDEESINTLYADFPETNADAREFENVKGTMAGYYAMARQFLGRKSSILDVGCDVGLLLEAAAEDGFSELHGVEPVASPRRMAQQRLPDASIYKAFYEDCRLPENHFDLIALIHVVDHLIRPVQILERAFSQLRPGGVVLAVVHDNEALLARLMGERYPVYNFFHHYFFSQATLSELFSRCGFEVVKMGHTRNRYSLAFFADRFPLLPAVLRHRVADALRASGIGKVSLTLPVGNIGIVARKPVQ